MALRRTLAKHLHNRALKVKDHSPANFNRQMLTTPEKPPPAAAADDAGFFRRFLQQRKINQSSAMSLPELFNLPVGEKLREKLSISYGHRLRLDGLRPPADLEISVEEARKILKCSQLQKVKSALKEIPTSSVNYSEFVEICANVSRNHDQGAEFAKMLDEGGDVIVLGDNVFLHPDQIAKSMGKLISQSMGIQSELRKQELEELETQKAIIDRKAVSQVRSELYCGLGFLVAQTLAFMRLTFWELSWDVMEPICFFVTSFHFALAYMFFLRTSKEPTFESYFQRRFKVKQRKLMDAYNFDREKYIELCQMFYPHYQAKHSSHMDFEFLDSYK